MPFPADENLLEISAQRYGVLWTPMRFFYQNGGHHARRLSCSYLEPDRVREGVRRLSQLVAETA